MLSVTSLDLTNSIVKCFRKRISEQELADSMAFIIAYKEKSDLYNFTPGKMGMRYEWFKDSPVYWECSKYVEKFEEFPPSVILSTSKKLWYKALGVEVEFNANELSLLREIGIVLL